MIWQQLEYVLASFAAGAIVVFLYDLLLIFREIMWHSRFLIAVEDILFWIAAGVTVFFVVIYSINEGAVRGYAVFGMAVGMYAGHMIVGRRILRLARKAVVKVQKWWKMRLEKKVRK